jgi:hypothetical protein
MVNITIIIILNDEFTINFKITTPSLSTHPAYKSVETKTLSWDNCFALPVGIFTNINYVVYL